MDLGADVSTVDTQKYATHRLRADCGITVTCYNEGTTVSLRKNIDLSSKMCVVMG
jgi:hypothetical protein